MLEKDLERSDEERDVVCTYNHECEGEKGRRGILIKGYRGEKSGGPLDQSPKRCATMAAIPLLVIAATRSEISASVTVSPCEPNIPSLCLLGTR